MSKTSSISFEIGVVYRKGGRLFLAVDNRTLITFKDGELTEVHPHQRYDVVRGISVEDLCKRWDTPLQQLDEITASYLAPPEDLRTRPRGSRRRRAADHDSWRALRTIRLVS